MKKTMTIVAALVACAFTSQAADAAAPAAASTPASAGATAAVVAVEPAAPMAAEKEINTLADEELVGKAFENFSASVMFGYESEYVFRGTRVCGASLTPEVDVGYDFGAGFAAYAGVWGNLALDSSSYKEIDVYTGVTYTFDSLLTFDIGYLAYLYPNVEDTDNSNELKAAVSLDTTQWFGDFNVSPFVAFFYDFNLKATTIESGLTYSAPVTKWIADRNWGTIDLGAAYGHVTCDDGAYNYVTLTADAVVAINSYMSISAGIRYALRDNMELARASDDYVGVNRLWFGTSMTIGF